MKRAKVHKGRGDGAKIAKFERVYFLNDPHGQLEGDGGGIF